MEEKSFLHRQFEDIHADDMETRSVLGDSALAQHFLAAEGATVDDLPEATEQYQSLARKVKTRVHALIVYAKGYCHDCLVNSQAEDIELSLMGSGQDIAKAAMNEPRLSELESAVQTRLETEGGTKIKGWRKKQPIRELLIDLSSTQDRIELIEKQL